MFCYFSIDNGWSVVTTNRTLCHSKAATNSIPSPTERAMPVIPMETTPSSHADESPLVLLAQPLFPEFAAALAGRYRFALAADADAAAAAEARVLLVPGLAPVTAQHLSRLPALELVAGTSVGVDHVDLDTCRRRGHSVTNAGPAFAVDSADYAVGLVIDDLTYEEYPVKILDKQLRTTRKNMIKFCKVQWSNHNEEEATWEREDALREEFSNLFS